jgi:hypothetical protein
VVSLRILALHCMTLIYVLCYEPQLSTDLSKMKIHRYIYNFMNIYLCFYICGYLCICICVTNAHAHRSARTTGVCICTCILHEYLHISKYINLCVSVYTWVYAFVYVNRKSCKYYFAGIKPLASVQLFVSRVYTHEANRNAYDMW